MIIIPTFWPLAFWASALHYQRALRETAIWWVDLTQGNDFLKDRT